jgi:hypothetical protein
MKIILTCGHPYSGHYLVGKILRNCGVGEAFPSRLESYTPEVLQTKIFEVCEWLEDGSNKASLPALGKMWQELASSLLIANLSQPIWGWADSQTVWLLEFWKDFDPQIRFILVYSSPEFVICNMLQRQIDAPEDMDSLLTSWNRYNTELLRFYNRNQDRCLLVNAQTSLQYPQILIDKLSEAFGINLQLLEDDNNTLNTSRIAAGLACSLINNTNPTDQNILYQELESTADIISSGVKPSAQERLLAWSEYNRLISELTSNANLAGQQQQELAMLKAQQTELKQQTRHNQTKQHELEEENELLLLQLHQIQEELEQHFLAKQELAEKEKQLISDITTKQQEIDNLRVNTLKFDEREKQLVSDITTKQQEIDNLRVNTLKFDEREKQLVSDITTKQQEIDNLRVNTLKFDEREKQLVSDITTKQQEIDSLRVNTLKFDEREKQLVSDITTKQQEIDNLRVNTLKFDEREKQLVSDITTKQQEIDNLRVNTLKFDEREKQLVSDITTKQQEIDNLRVNTLKFDEIIRIKQELEQENELLLLQLYQAQEEFEHYFLEYQKISSIPPKPDYNLTGISLDPRKDTFTGDNWYYAEHDGRWAGPNTSSTINIPPLALGKDYEIVLDVIGSLTKEIVDGMKASINGKPINIQHPKPLSAWKRRFKKEKYSYPRKLRMHFSALDADNSQPWVLKLDFPKVLSPSECGGDSQDKRKLAIRLHNITLKQL